MQATRPLRSKRLDACILCDAMAEGAGAAEAAEARKQRCAEEPAVTTRVGGGAVPWARAGLRVSCGLFKGARSADERMRTETRHDRERLPETRRSLALSRLRMPQARSNTVRDGQKHRHQVAAARTYLHVLASSRTIRRNRAATSLRSSTRTSCPLLGSSPAQSTTSSPIAAHVLPIEPSLTTAP